MKLRYDTKKALVLFLVLGCALLLALPSRAADTKSRKLGRGFSNLLFGVVEVPKNMMDINEQYGSAAGITWGLFRGLGRFATREVVGGYEIVTFWAPQGPIIEPEFLFQPWEDVEWRVMREGQWY